MGFALVVARRFHMRNVVGLAAVVAVFMAVVIYLNLISLSGYCLQMLSITYALLPMRENDYRGGLVTI